MDIMHVYGQAKCYKMLGLISFAAIVHAAVWSGRVYHRFRDLKQGVIGFEDILRQEVVLGLLYVAYGF